MKYIIILKSKVLASLPLSICIIINVQYLVQALSLTVSSDVAATKATEGTIKPDAGPMTRLGHISDKVRHRLFALAMQALQHAQKVITEALGKFVLTASLVSMFLVGSNYFVVENNTLQKMP